MRDARPPSSGDDRSPGAAGDERDEVAEDRDRIAEGRDRASEARDGAAGTRDKRADTGDGGSEAAVADRVAALGDRQASAEDRGRAAGDRSAASGDRAASGSDRAASAIDELTGAHRRQAGAIELKREIDRAKRTKQPFVLAFVDVDGLKGRNDLLGHAAGDRLLRATTASIRTHLRGYDLIVRFGGDEFLCALPDVTMAQAAERFSLVNAELASTQQASLTVGLAELQPDETAEDLIARADEAMYERRRQLP